MLLASLRILLVSILLAVSAHGDALAYFAEEKKPNIILLYVDDLGFGDIGVNGATAVKTPNIDQLAAEGLNFTDAHSTAVL